MSWQQLQEFFTDDTPEQIVFREEDYFLKDDPELGHQIEWLVPNAQKNQMEPIRMTLAPRGRSCVEPPHAGEEMGYVLEGSVFLRWVRKPTAYKKEKRFIFLPARNTGWKPENGVLRSCGSPPRQISDDKKEIV